MKYNPENEKHVEIVQETKNAMKNEEELNMPQHTPAPWTVIRVNEGNFDIMATGITICHGNSVDAITKPDESKANGQLIGAAPDLLEALKYAYKKLNCKDTIIENALNKAKGI